MFQFCKKEERRTRNWQRMKKIGFCEQRFLAKTPAGNERAAMGFHRAFPPCLLNNIIKRLDQNEVHAD